MVSSARLPTILVKGRGDFVIIFRYLVFVYVWVSLILPFTISNKPWWHEEFSIKSYPFHNAKWADLERNT